MLCELGDVISEVASLGSATGGGVSWVEVEDDILAVFHVLF